ncbi:MAG: hypothetical protein RHS_5922 [Robinsoniella sp. RHS]|uniref:hypothetical protein n=1 Tax=Robinsoniella sp. RHS TaxID=1504536 RepID=UPI00064B1090|nr:MAG: hypothetical protein RHS_5922 [Robinsoniella sp. RHS]
MYKAVKKNTQIYLARPKEQIEQYLEHGCDIYKEDDNGNIELIATPTQGMSEAEREVLNGSRYNSSSNHGSNVL